MKNMRKIVVFYHIGYVGEDGVEFVEVPDSMSDEEINDNVWQAAIEHAETYGVYPPDYDADDEDYDDSNISHNIGGWFEDYDPEKHDGHRISNEDTWRRW